MPFTFDSIPPGVHKLNLWPVKTHFLPESYIRVVVSLSHLGDDFAFRPERFLRDGRGASTSRKDVNASNNQSKSNAVHAYESTWQNLRSWRSLVLRGTNDNFA